MLTFGDPAWIDTALDSRSISFENPTGARGQGGTAAHGRKGAPSRILNPGETVTLADIKGPGRIRHIWMTFPPGPPEEMRAVWMEMYYDDLSEPSISVPCLDFFGLPHGRPTPYFSALTSVQEGRGFNATFPLPFRKRARLILTHSGSKPINFYYQVDYTLEDVPPEQGYLHVMFRRENPTTLKKDFVIADGLRGPGRFLGSAIGIRVLQDGMSWYGEGEFKFYRDGDTTNPTICGTGLEDYVGSAWGLHQHTALYAGAPLNVVAPEHKDRGMPDFIGFYRWHLPDPLIFHDEFKATIQQIGIREVPAGREELMKSVPVAGHGWENIPPPPGGGKPPHVTIAERRDDYSAAAFVYCRDPQPARRLDAKGACADIALLPYEKA
jgi:hypothetical protein